MSWIVEESKNTSAVNVNDDTITCTKDDDYSSPINVMYKDPANQNGQYFWVVDFQNLNEEDGVSASVGLTTEKHFQSGWGLKAMNYLGNLSDGNSLLVSAFGNRIKSNDKVGILLQLTDEDLKMYIFHNDRPLGIAFHIQSPYPKPLFPVVSFSSNGTAKIFRLQQIPSLLDRKTLQFSGVEGDWQIFDYPQHPECIGCQFKITRHDHEKYIYDLYACIVNNLHCTLQQNPVTNQWKTSNFISTMMDGSSEQMDQESIISQLISNIQTLELESQQQLLIGINDNEQVRLERFIKAAPSPITQNIFN